MKTFILPSLFLASAMLPKFRWFVALLGCFVVWIFRYVNQHEHEQTRQNERHAILHAVRSVRRRSDQSQMPLGQ